MKPFELCIGLLLLSGCASHLSPHRRTDPLVEQIFNSGKPTKKRVLFQKIDQAQVVFLGEHHDNRRHHQIQLEIVQHMVSKGKKPLLAFEAFSQVQTSWLNAYVFGDPRASKRALQHLTEGSSKQKVVYLPLLQYARAQGLKLAGIDLDSGLSTRLTRHRPPQLSPLERQFLAPLMPNPDPAYQKAMIRRFTDGHCGWSDSELMSGLFRVWQQRNQTMAKGLAQLVEPGQKIVVILGSGHLEFGRAVLGRFKAIKPKIKTFSLALMEVALEPNEVEAYFYLYPDEKLTLGPSYQWGWLTDRRSWVDPCKRFKDQLMRHKKGLQP